MATEFLSPSIIRYSQDSISSKFQSGQKIGEVLDNILLGVTDVDDLPVITVYDKNDKWYSYDNRRLWVLKKAEQFGECNEVEVEETDIYNHYKFTTENRGKFIELRGHPGGQYWIRNMSKMETMKTKLMPLSDIKYSKDEIDGEDYSVAPGVKLDRIIRGEKKLNSHLPVVAFYHGYDHKNVRFHSLKNENLWILRKARKLGLLSGNDITIHIKDKMYEDEELFDCIFDTEDDGTHASVCSMGGRLWRKKLHELRHASCFKDPDLDFENFGIW